MFVLVILGVAAVAESVTVTQSKRPTEDAITMAFLVEDVEYQPSQLQKLQQRIARSGKKILENSRILKEENIEIEDGYLRRRRSTPSEDPFRFRIVEGNGWRRRSPQTQNNQVLPITNEESQDDQIAVESASRVSALSIANILKAAGAVPTKVVPQGGYGRKRRSPMDSSSNDFDSQLISEKVLSLSPSGGSDSRRKRSPHTEPAHSNVHQYGMVDNIEISSVSVKPHGEYGDLQKILALSGAKPQQIRGGVSYGRKKRSPLDLSNEIITNEIRTGPGLVRSVAIEAVKIKSHGNYGKIAQLYDAGANSKNVVFNGRFGRRKREDNFIPFNVYDERKIWRSNRMISSPYPWDYRLKKTALTEVWKSNILLQISKESTITLQPAKDEHDQLDTSENSSNEEVNTLQYSQVLWQTCEKKEIQDKPNKSPKSCQFQ